MQNHGKLQRMFMKVNILRVLFFIKLSQICQHKLLFNKQTQIFSFSISRGVFFLHNAPVLYILLLYEIKIILIVATGHSKYFFKEIVSTFIQTFSNTRSKLLLLNLSWSPLEAIIFLPTSQKQYSIALAFNLIIS